MEREKKERRERRDTREKERRKGESWKVRRKGGWREEGKGR